MHFRPGEGSKIVEVKAKRDFIIDGDKKIALSLEITKTADPVDWNNHHKIPDVIVCFSNVFFKFFRSRSIVRQFIYFL